MHITVVVPAFNIQAFLPTALRSVIAQSHAEWSMVVVDDGSTDATAGILDNFPDPRIRLVRQRNAGVSAARNHGIAALAHGPTGAFLFLDGDDWLAPNALALMAATLEAAPWAVAACGRHARVDVNGTTFAAPPPPEGTLLEQLLTRNLFANGGHLLLRREAVEAVGAWREDLSYGEDWEYWARVALLGEFATVRSAQPVLFVRERPGSAYLSRAVDPAAHRPAMEAIHRNPAIADRLGTARLACLRRRAESEIAWTIGRELIRHGQRRAGRRWLSRSVRNAPTLTRIILIGLSWLRRGRFRPYPSAG